MTNDRMTNSLARRALVIGAWSLVFFCLGGAAAAQDAWPGYSSSFSGPNEIARGPGFYFALNEDYTLSLQGIVSGESKGKDSFYGVPDNDSAETNVYLGPQINFTWSDKLSVQVGGDLPVSIDNTGLQAVPDFRVHAAFTWRF